MSTGYKKSTESFLFSLSNHYNTGPIKLPVKPAKIGNAVYHKSSYGPTFGGGHDLYISNKANENSNSYSNLGHSYETPDPNEYRYGQGNTKSLLAGGYKFMPSRVEVFYKRRS